MQVYAGIFAGANVFPQSQRDRALNSMDGYLPGEPRFNTLKEAHEAVQALVARALEGKN